MTGPIIPSLPPLPVRPPTPLRSHSRSPLPRFHVLQEAGNFHGTKNRERGMLCEERLALPQVGGSSLLPRVTP